MRTTMTHRLLMLAAGLSIFIAAPATADVLFGDSTEVKQNCAACHKPDPQGRLEVIEETRKSTEEWKVVVDRMIRLNSAPLSDEDFYPVIKELSDTLCLTPRESREIAYINSDENSQYREIPKNDLETRIYTACVRCHTYAKIASHKMTTSQWAENRNLHLGYYPTVVPQMREMDWVKESEELVEPLAKLFPFKTDEYDQWIQERPDQNLSGSWTVAGYQPGIGYYYGTYTLTPNPDKGDDEYLIERSVRYQNGTELTTGGEGTLYSQYHLRYALAPTALTGRVEGVFDLDAGTGQFQGKWWAVVQDGNAYGNEAFVRSDGSPGLMAAFPQSLRIAAGEAQELTLVGVGLAQGISPADIQFSVSGITVQSITASTPSQVTCQVSVDAGAEVGMAEVSVKGISYSGLKLFKTIDALSVSPRIGRARVSCGAAYPPQGVQFVARAISFGADGQEGTADDLVLDPVDADWSLEEEKTREDDDDMKYIKAPIVNGLYTPVTSYAPIKTRKQNREGVGLIAVKASLKDQDRTLTDRVRLAVTVTDFITHLK